MHQPRRKPSLGHKRVTAADRKRRQRNLLPHLKIFFAKTPSTEKATPFLGQTVFGQVFGRGGMSNFQNPTVPPYRGVAPAAGTSKLVGDALTRAGATHRAGDRRQSTLISPEVPEPVG
jgi:hypothetical protein